MTYSYRTEKILKGSTEDFLEEVLQRYSNDNWRLVSCIPDYKIYTMKNDALMIEECTMLIFERET